MASSSSSKTKLATETDDTKSVTITARAEEEVKPPERRSRVQFTAETVDNEGMGRKSSKGNPHLTSPHLTLLSYSLLYLQKAKAIWRVIIRVRFVR